MLTVSVEETLCPKCGEPATQICELVFKADKAQVMSDGPLQVWYDGSRIDWESSYYHPNQPKDTYWLMCYSGHEWFTKHGEEDWT